MTEPSGSLRDLVRSRAVPERLAPEVAAIVEALLRAGGDRISGLIFFGSRKTQATPDAWSAYDFFLVTLDYLGFYRALGRAGRSHRSPRLLSVLNRWLPPSQIGFLCGEGPSAPLAKCAVISLGRLERETSEKRRDHFCVGRLFQPAALVHAADDSTRDRLIEALVRAQRLSYHWVRPWLAPRFDAGEYYKTLLRVSLSREIRPEPLTRVDALWRAQRDHGMEMAEALLRELAGQGELEDLGGGHFGVRRKVGPMERTRRELHFRRSMVRSTVRWAKHMITFENWLEYLVRKASRHSGRPIELSANERRWPLLFLWPRLFRFLRDKNK